MVIFHSYVSLPEGTSPRSPLQIIISAFSIGCWGSWAQSVDHWWLTAWAGGPATVQKQRVLLAQLQCFRIKIIGQGHLSHPYPVIELRCLGLVVLEFRCGITANTRNSVFLPAVAGRQGLQHLSSDEPWGWHRWGPSVVVRCVVRWISCSKVANIMDLANTHLYIVI